MNKKIKNKNLKIMWLTSNYAVIDPTVISILMIILSVIDDVSGYELYEISFTILV